MIEQGEIARRAFANSRVDPNWLRSYIEQNAANHGLVGLVPRDGARYGIRTGSAAEWANFMVPLAHAESGLKNSTVGDVGHFGTGSRGLFQLSIGDAPNYGLNGGRPFTHEQLADPVTNTNAAMAILGRLVGSTGSVQAGAGKYWGPVRRGWTPGGAKIPPGGSQPSLAATMAPGAPAPAGQPQVPQQATPPAAPRTIDPALAQWAMSSDDQPQFDAAVAGRPSPVPADAQVPIQPLSPFIPAFAGPEAYRLGLIAPVDAGTGEPLDVILAGVA